MTWEKSIIRQETLSPLKVSVPKQILYQDLGGEAVLLDLKSGNYYGLNGVGSRIWELMLQGQQPADICNTLLQEYEIEEAILCEDLRTFLFRLAEQGIIHISDDNNHHA